MRHLIIGGSGFLGSNLACALHRRGERVRVFDIVEPLNCPEAVEFVRGNVFDREDVKKAMKDADYVYHVASLVPLTKAGSNFWKINVGGTKIVVSVSYETSVKMLIYISSSAIFAGSLDKCPITEDTVPNPIEIYGRSKLVAERYFLERVQKIDLPYAIIRPRCILGPGRLGIFQILFNWIYNNKKVYLVGDGEQLFQFIHVDDVVEFCILCAENESTGIYNIGTDEYSTLKNLLMELIHYAHSTAQIVNLPEKPSVLIFKILDLLNLFPLAPFHYLTYNKPFYFDISKAMNELNWKPKYSNAQMLIESYDWFVANYDKVKLRREHSINMRPFNLEIFELVKRIF